VRGVCFGDRKCVDITRRLSVQTVEIWAVRNQMMCAVVHVVHRAPCNTASASKQQASVQIVVGELCVLLGTRQRPGSSVLSLYEPDLSILCLA
jgi:hypothetical protein